MKPKSKKLKRSVSENEYAYTEYKGKKVSKNDRARQIMGYRNQGHPGANALFCPAELGYACPICGEDHADALEWSEYTAFIWCPNCNLDIPSCLCVKRNPPNLGQRPLTPKKKTILATEVFLDTIEDHDRRKEIRKK